MQLLTQRVARSARFILLVAALAALPIADAIAAEMEV